MSSILPFPSPSSSGPAKRNSSSQGAPAPASAGVDDHSINSTHGSSSSKLSHQHLPTVGGSGGKHAGEPLPSALAVNSAGVGPGGCSSTTSPERGHKDKEKDTKDVCCPGSTTAIYVAPNYYRPPPPSGTGSSAFTGSASAAHKRFHSSGSAASGSGGGGGSGFVYHPRQPGPQSDSYFSGALPPANLGPGSFASSTAGGRSAGARTGSVSGLGAGGCAHARAVSSFSSSATATGAGAGAAELPSHLLADNSSSNAGGRGEKEVYSSTSGTFGMSKSHSTCGSYFGSGAGFSTMESLSIATATSGERGSLTYVRDSSGAETATPASAAGGDGASAAPATTPSTPAVVASSGSNVSIKDVLAGGPASSLTHLNLGPATFTSSNSSNSNTNNSNNSASAGGTMTHRGRSSTLAGALSSLSFGFGSANSGATASAHAATASVPASASVGGGGGLLQQQQQQMGAARHPSAHPQGRPPSPSTLTDVLLGLHATLYGGKRKPEQVREMVGRYYEGNALFESPLLSAHGHEQIANQFIMAFSLPGLDVRSELRDVICSDFEFDGTRAGIIDQTITVTFLPWLFGRDTMSQEAADAEAASLAYGHYYASASGVAGSGPASYASYPMSARGGGAGGGAGGSGGGGGTAYGYGYAQPGSSGIHGAHGPGTAPVTPHPFANYQTQTPGASSFSRFGGEHGFSSILGIPAPHSPTMPYYAWGGSGGGGGGDPRMAYGQSHMGAASVGHSRPHTPGWTSAMAGGNVGGSGFFGSFGGSASGVRPLSSAHPHPQQQQQQTHAYGAGPAHGTGAYGYGHSQSHTTASSVNGDSFDDDDDDGFGVGSSISQRHAGSSVIHTGTAGAPPPSSAFPLSASASLPPTAGLPPEPSHYVTSSAAAAAAGATDLVVRPAMPEDAIQPHWSSEGFGRRSVRSLVWGLLHPRKALKSLCSIQLRLMSRLEFNDAGMIVRHEDTWGMREAIEGILPFASIIYPLHRRIVGTLVSFSIAKGFSLRDSIIFRKPLSISDGEPNAPHGITASSSSGESTPLARQQLAQSVTNEAHGQGQGQDPHVAALALLDRSQYKGHNNPEHYRTISRSRNASPSRYRWGNISERSFQTGTRSRARSLIGGVQTGGGGGTTTTSSVAGSNDNLSLWYAGHHHMHSGSSILDRERDRDLPPDSSARYRDRVARRADGGRTTSAPPSTLGDTAPVADVGVGMQANAPSSLAGLWMDDFGRKDRIQGAD